MVIENRILERWENYCLESIRREYSGNSGLLLGGGTLGLYMWRSYTLKICVLYGNYPSKALSRKYTYKVSFSLKGDMCLFRKMNKSWKSLNDSSSHHINNLVKFFSYLLTRHWLPLSAFLPSTSLSFLLSLCLFDIFHAWM